MAREIKRSELTTMFPTLATSHLGSGKAAVSCLDEAVADQEPRKSLLVNAMLKVMELDQRRLALVDAFVEQIADINDPDAVETFLCWKSHPVLDTILLLSAKLDEEDQNEVLNVAEDLARQSGAGAIHRA